MQKKQKITDEGLVKTRIWLKLGLSSGHSDFDDALQEGLMVLIKARKLFDPTLGTAWGSYAAVSIDRKLRRWNTRRLRRGMTPIRYDLPPPDFLIGPAETEDGYEFIAGREPDPSDAACSHERARKVRQVVKSLPERERFIVRSVLMKEEGHKVAGEKYGVCRQSIQQQLGRIKQKLSFLLPCPSSEGV